MAENALSPDPANSPDDLRVQVEWLLEGLRVHLGGDLVGLYLHGSAAMGCFNRRCSDLDLLAVTANRIAIESRREIARLLLDLSRHPYPVEISFLSWDDLHPWRYPTPYDFHYSEHWRERLTAELHGSAGEILTGDGRIDSDLAAHITVTRARGVCLWGQPIVAVFPEVPRQDFIHSLREDVLSDVYGLASDLSNPVYVVLNACRTYLYLRTGEILSKEQGGARALSVLSARCAAAVAWALTAYRADGAPLPPDPDMLSVFVDFMRAEMETYFVRSAATSKLAPDGSSS